MSTRTLGFLLIEHTRIDLLNLLLTQTDQIHILRKRSLRPMVVLVYQRKSVEIVTKLT
jgi:hypothetical protein